MMNTVGAILGMAMRALGFSRPGTTSAVPQSKRGDRLDRWVCLSHTDTRSTRVAGMHFEMDHTAEGRKLRAKAMTRGPG